MRTIFHAAGAGVIAALLCAVPALAAAPQAKIGEEARIPFADTTGIRNFHAENDHALYIEGQTGRWYYAETMGPCMGLNFATQIGFITKGTGTLDKFGQILVDGRTCQLKSLVNAEDPGKKAKAEKADSKED
ncbi:DUF6491 family protein [Sphingosinicella microcystinivorans]|uniref:Beta/gamma crystallin n=1 Tax=Sphingosinicella microcystinivorans TaxID=335406 RepID=A0AAD1D4Q6_SPHMI|nr:DUF6491 family protein [Sphingosinicella microcystinivorans]RKS90840.1 hypothetical protein DFR51_0382 [Sphingosinicella microcystinivorans]BBE33756.1 hypothetical protein SmB9_14140 [Sphingosinicella microcystinivorans]